MANGKLIAGYIFAILAVVLILVATAIVGIISTRYNDQDTRTRLRASTAITGLTTLFAIITAIIGILFARAKGKEGNQYKALGIAFLILAIITLAMYATVIGLNLSVRARNNINQTDKNALLIAIIVMAAGFISLVIATILFFSLTRGKSGAEAIQNLKFQRRSNQPMSVSSSTTSRDSVTTSTQTETKKLV